MILAAFGISAYLYNKIMLRLDLANKLYNFKLQKIKTTLNDDKSTIELLKKKTQELTKESYLE